jgi:hypothetical protein
MGSTNRGAIVQDRAASPSTWRPSLSFCTAIRAAVQSRHVGDVETSLLTKGRAMGFQKGQPAEPALTFTPRREPNGPTGKMDGPSPAEARARDTHEKLEAFQTYARNRRCTAL